MYLEFYGLSEKPFSQTPDPRFLYWNDAYRETLASLSYGIRERKGFIAMIGEAGTGKTTLLRKLLDDLGDEIVSVFLFNPNATFEEILEYTLSELGIASPSGRKLVMLQRLNEFLLSAYAEGRNTILLIDEAQDLDNDVLESLRLLSNLETSDDKILQIVLSGQPELARTLADPALLQLKQRISVRCRLQPLRYEELPSYLSARLEIAGGSPALFDPDAFPAIWDFAAGIPRMINTACDNALLLGYALGKRTIDAGVIEEVIEDLHKLDVDSWFPTAARDTPTRIPAPPETPPPSAAPPPAIPAPAAPAPISSATRPPRPARSPGWLVAGILAGMVLLMAGAWLGRMRDREPGVPDSSGTASSADGSASPKLAAAVPAARTTNVQHVEPSPPTRPATAAAPPARAPLEPHASPPPRREDRGEEPRGPLAQSGAGRHGATVTTDLDRPSAGPASADEETASPRGRGDRPARDTAMGAGPGPVPQTLLASADLPMTAPPSAAIAATAAATAGGSPGQPVPRQETIPPPVGDRIAPVKAPAPTKAESPEPARPNVSVAPGDTLLELAARRYGTSNLTTLDMLKLVNPGIRDVDLIIAGQGLLFPDPGPASRVLRDDAGYTVLAMTTQTLSRALALQSSLEDQLDRPVSLERVSTPGGPSQFRVSVRGIGEHAEAAAIATALGSILRDPSP